MHAHTTDTLAPHRHTHTYTHSLYTITCAKQQPAAAHFTYGASEQKWEIRSIANVRLAPRMCAFVFYAFVYVRGPCSRPYVAFLLCGAVPGRKGGGSAAVADGSARDSFWM